MSAPVCDRSRSRLPFVTLRSDFTYLGLLNDRVGVTIGDPGRISSELYWIPLMSQREFQGLLNQGSVLTSSRFWSGKNLSLKEMESAAESTSNELEGSAQSSEVQKWKEKLEAAQQEF